MWANQRLVAARSSSWARRSPRCAARSSACSWDEATWPRARKVVMRGMIRGGIGFSGSCRRTPGRSRLARNASWTTTREGSGRLARAQRRGEQGLAGCTLGGRGAGGARRAASSSRSSTHGVIGGADGKALGSQAWVGLAGRAPSAMRAQTSYAAPALGTDGTASTTSARFRQLPSTATAAFSGSRSAHAAMILSCCSMDSSPANDVNRR